MKIELEFLEDRKEIRLQEEELLYQEPVPFPAVGDSVLLTGGQSVRVTRRVFMYGNAANEPRAVAMKISFWCETACVNPRSWGHVVDR
jgi:hypothetical protein